MDLIDILLSRKLNKGSGSGGTTNYLQLTNKPKINNVELSGNKTAQDLGLAAQSDIPTVPVQSVNGKTGAVNLDSGDIEFDSTQTYQSGTVGAELTDLTRQISDKDVSNCAPIIINTASGAIASFDDGADNRPIRKLVAQIEPVQDLHGQDSPYPAGCGKNKLKTGGLIQGAPSDTTFGNATKRTFTLGTFVTDLTPNNYYQPNRVTQVSVAENAISVTTDAAAYALALPMTGLTVGAVYVVSAVKTNGVITVSFYKEDGTFISNTVENPANFTVPAETYYTLIHFNPTGGGTQATYTDIQLELGSSATSFAPYENLCPISGHTGAEITQRGKNLLPDDYSVYDSISSGNYLVLNDVVPPGELARFTFIDKDTSVVIPSDVNFGFVAEDLVQGSSPINFNWAIYRGQPNNESRMLNNGAGISSGIYARNVFMYPKTKETFDTIFSRYYVMVELGDIKTDFEPYTGNQISVTFPETIYGGEDEVISGKLKVDIFNGVIDNFIGDGYAYNQTDDFYYGYLPDAFPTPAKSGGIFDFLRSSNPRINNHDCAYIFPSRIIRINISQLERTAEAYRAYLAQHPLQVVYSIAPIEYQLTPQEIDTLLGTNNIWSSTGDTTVEYSADTKLYIDGKLAELQATILENIGG